MDLILDPVEVLVTVAGHERRPNPIHFLSLFSFCCSMCLQFNMFNWSVVQLIGLVTFATSAVLLLLSHLGPAPSTLVRDKRILFHGLHLPSAYLHFQKLLYSK
jgi:hypothetical protein